MNRSRYLIKKVCTVCGKEYKGELASKYCGDECRRKKTEANCELSKENARIQSRIRKNSKRLKEQNMKLADIEAQARKAGMNYGEYVARMGIQ